jgi:cysteinyl-tRNA synthetase
MQGAAKALESVYDFVYRASQAESRQSANGQSDAAPEAWQQPFIDKFVASINDDLNMPGALASVHELITEANRRGEPAAILPTLYDWDKVLGLRLKETAEKRASESLPAELQDLIERRQAARKERNFALADELRGQLREAGIELEDTPQGVRWKRV